MLVASWNNSLSTLHPISQAILAPSRRTAHHHRSCPTCLTTPTLTQALLVNQATWLRQWACLLTTSVSSLVTPRLMVLVPHTLHHLAWTHNHKHILSSPSSGHANQAHPTLVAINYPLADSFLCLNTTAWQVLGARQIRFPKMRA